MLAGASTASINHLMGGSFKILAFDSPAGTRLVFSVKSRGPTFLKARNVSGSRLPASITVKAASASSCGTGKIQVWESARELERSGFFPTFLLDLSRWLAGGEDLRAPDLPETPPPPPPPTGEPRSLGSGPEELLSGPPHGSSIISRLRDL